MHMGSITWTRPLALRRTFFREEELGLGTEQNGVDKPDQSAFRSRGLVWGMNSFGLLL